MISLTFHGGAGEIGGNKILLEYGGARTYLDFGQSFDFGEDYFLDWLKPGAANGLECYFEFDILPKIPRLYSQSMLEFTDLPYERPDIDGVFISHHHSDHIGNLSFIDEAIPVHLGHGTKAIIDAYSELFPGLVNIGDHDDIQTFKSGDRIPVKDLVFRPVHVEHSAPGAKSISSWPNPAISTKRTIRKSSGNISQTRSPSAKSAEIRHVHQLQQAHGARLYPSP